MTDSAKLTHVIDVQIGQQMFDRLMTGNPVALGFDQINAQVRIAFDEEVINKLTTDDPPPD